MSRLSRCPSTGQKGRHRLLPGCHYHRCPCDASIRHDVQMCWVMPPSARRYLGLRVLPPGKTCMFHTSKMTETWMRSSEAYRHGRNGTMKANATLYSGEIWSMLSYFRAFAPHSRVLQPMRVWFRDMHCHDFNVRIWVGRTWVYLCNSVAFFVLLNCPERGIMTFRMQYGTSCGTACRQI